MVQRSLKMLNRDSLVETAYEKIKEEARHQKIRSVAVQYFCSTYSEDDSQLDLSFAQVVTTSSGVAYFDELREFGTGREFVGNSIDSCWDALPAALKVAVVDSLLSEENADCSKPNTLRGDCYERGVARAELIANTIRDHVPQNSKVVLVGAVSSILAALIRVGHVQVESVLDLSPHQVGKRVSGMLVECGSSTSYGSRTLERVASADLVLATGMTLVNDTLKDIAQTAGKNGTRLFVYAQSAPNLLKCCVGKGIDCLFAEKFPFYLIPETESVVEVVMK